jgi:very-short-patch-repair endonuclease
MKTKIEQNVLDFLDKASSDYGSLKAENFSIDTWASIAYGDIKSPIEQIYYIAFRVMSEHYSSIPREFQVQLNDPCEIYIQPQVSIGKYRVDFLISYVDVDCNLKQAVVELDGHDFHDKDKKQRAYEKARDRYLTLQRYSVLHFTGSELVSDPYKAILETLVAVSVADESYLLKHDKLNPFGIA